MSPVVSILTDDPKLLDYYNSEKSKFQRMLKESRARKKLIAQNMKYLHRQYEQEDWFDQNLDYLIGRRNVLPQKLEKLELTTCDDTDDEDITVLRNFVSRVEFVSNSHQDECHEVKKRSHEMVTLIESRPQIYSGYFHRKSTSIGTELKFVSSVSSESYHEETKETHWPQTTRSRPQGPKHGQSIRQVSENVFDRKPAPCLQDWASRLGISTPNLTLSDWNYELQEKERPPEINPGKAVCRKKVATAVFNQTPFHILAIGQNARHLNLMARENRWEPWQTDKNFGWGFEVIFYKKKLFIIGGQRRQRELGFEEPTSSLDIFCFRTNQWTTGPNLSSERYDMSSCVVGRQRTIYACGGRKSIIETFDSVEELELDRSGQPLGEWCTVVARMRQKRFACAAIPVGHCIYVTGGHDEDQNYLSSIEIFDTNLRTWQFGPEMLYCRSNHGIEYYNGNIYVMGGEIDFNTVTLSCERLDIESWTWNRIAPLRVPRYQFGSVKVNGKVYIVGGLTDGDEENLTSVDILDLSSNSRTAGTRLPFPLSFTRCVTSASIQGISGFGPCCSVPVSDD